jgi:hypothetical protein
MRMWLRLAILRLYGVYLGLSRCEASRAALMCVLVFCVGTKVWLRRFDMMSTTTFWVQVFDDTVTSCLQQQ